MKIERNVLSKKYVQVTPERGHSAKGDKVYVGNKQGGCLWSI